MNHNTLCLYLGADAVVAAVQQGADISQVIADGLHRRVIFDVDINDGGDERSRQLLAPDHYILKTCCLHLLLKLLKTETEWQGEQQ